MDISRLVRRSGGGGGDAQGSHQHARELPGSTEPGNPKIGEGCLRATSFLAFQQCKTRWQMRCDSDSRSARSKACRRAAAVARMTRVKLEPVAVAERKIWWRKRQRMQLAAGEEPERRLLVGLFWLVCEVDSCGSVRAQVRAMALCLQMQVRQGSVPFFHTGLMGPVK